MLLIANDGFTKTGNFPGLAVRGGAPNFFGKLKTKQPVTIVYFGGSITNHPGYRIFSEDWFKRQYPESKFTTVTAGIGGRNAYHYHPT